MNPRDLLYDLAFHACCLDNRMTHLRAPGAIIDILSEKNREVIRGLSSDDIKDVRPFEWMEPQNHARRSPRTR